MKNHLKNKEGFTLVELVFVIGILASIAVGMVQLYIHTAAMADLSGNVSIAVSQAQNILEEIREHDYDLISADYGAGGNPGNKFDLTLMTGKGRIYLDTSNAELIEIEVVVSWEDRYGRIIGEDLDLDGELDGGEDSNGDSKLSSIVTLMSMVTRR